MRVQRLTPINARTSSIIDAIVEAFNFLWRSFLSFLRRHDIKLTIRSSYHFYFYCESKKTMERSWIDKNRTFVRRDDSFPEANPIVQFLEMAKGISVIKSKYASSTLTVFELMPNRFYPHGEIAKSPVSSLHPPWGCWIHDAKQFSGITHHWQRITVKDLSTIWNPWNPTQLPTR